MATPDDDSRDRDQLASGPRKPRPPRGAAPPEFTTHKIRAHWFEAREAWPVREAPLAALLRERARVRAELPSAPGNEAWTLAGPTNIGGRMTALLVHPNQPERLVAGAAGGGVWTSTDGGRSWTPRWHDEPNLNIGALAHDPHDPEVVYCGTGEANLSADSHPGFGLLRSADFGLNWQVHAVAASNGLPNRIGTIAVDPFERRHIRLGGVSHMPGMPTGLFVSRDGGVSWARDNGITPLSYRCHMVLFHPTIRNLLFATITARGTASGIWKSEDGGASWRQMTAGLPSTDSFGRTSLAIAPSDPDVMYALAANNQRGVLGVFRSSDRGESWASIGGKHFADERQMSYNNTIAVHPTNADHVLCGGVDLHRSTNGGQTWRRVTVWFRDRGASDYAHADHHHLVMPAAEPDWVYDMNDGGMDFSANGGRTWENRSDGLAVTMYYDLEVAQSDGRMFGGGTQDNGTNLTLTGQPNDHFMAAGGDGGWIVIDRADARHLYASSQRMRILRFRTSDGWQDVSPLPSGNAERQSMWMVYIAMDPSDARRVFTGTQRVWRTIDDGDSWQPVSGVLDGSDITALEIARADPQRIYAGTENGGFFRSTDGGTTWSNDLATTMLPGRTITRIRCRPDDADSVYVTIANFGNRHVFHSHDGGLIWNDVDGGNLPDVPHHGIAISPDEPDRVFVCHDAGVAVSFDRGATWQDLSRNLPNVMVVDLVHHDADRTLTAATYGRSLWRLQLT